MGTDKFLFISFLLKILLIIAVDSTACPNIQEGKLYQFMNTQQNCAVDMDSGTRDVGHPFQTWDPDRNAYERHFIKQMPYTNNYIIISYNSNLTFDASSNPIKQQVATCAATQQFTFNAGPNNSCYIYSVSSPNQVITRVSVCQHGNITLQVMSNGSTNQLWSFVPDTTVSNFKPLYPTCARMVSTTNLVTSTSFISTTSLTSSKAHTTSTFTSSKRTLISSVHHAPLSSDLFSSTRASNSPKTEKLNGHSPTVESNSVAHTSTGAITVQPSYTKTDILTSEPTATTSTLMDGILSSNSFSILQKTMGIELTSISSTTTVKNMLPHSSSTTVSIKDSAAKEIYSKDQVLTTTKTFRPTTDLSEICNVDEWSSFSPCSATCGDTVTQTRFRNIIKPGQTCPFPLVDVQHCDAAFCNPMSPLEQKAALVMQTLGCAWIIGLSAASLFLSLLFWSRKTTRILHASEELCLLLAHCIIAYARSETKNITICTLAEIGLQYFFLVHFTCLALEALHVFSITTTVVITESYFSSKTNLFIAWGFPLIITTVTATLSYHRYISKYSCWLNIGNNISIGTFLPIVFCTCVSFVLLESAGQYSLDVAKISEPLIKAIIYVTCFMIIQRGLLFIVPINFAAWFIGMMAIYEQNFAWFTTVFQLNLTLGVFLAFFHVLANEKGRDFIVSNWKNFCRRK